jgi:hypothetical protein
MGLKLRG